MVGRFDVVKQGDLLGIKDGVHVLLGPKSRPNRSQSIRMSVEAE